jgi:hypothetical protein
LERIG